MKKILLSLCLFSVTNLFSIDFSGTWVLAKYEHNEPYNSLDIINIEKINNNEYLVQHSFYVFSELDYFVKAKLNSDGTLSFIDPHTNWEMILSTRMWGPNTEVLELYPVFDKEFIGQYQRLNSDFLDFLENIDTWLIDNQRVMEEY